MATGKKAPIKRTMKIPLSKTGDSESNMTIKEVHTSEEILPSYQELKCMSPDQRALYLLLPQNKRDYLTHIKQIEDESQGKEHRLLVLSIVFPLISIGLSLLLGSIIRRNRYESTHTHGTLILDEPIE